MDVFILVDALITNFYNLLNKELKIEGHGKIPSSSVVFPLISKRLKKQKFKRPFLYQNHVLSHYKINKTKIHEFKSIIMGIKQKEYFERMTTMNNVGGAEDSFIGATARTPKYSTSSGQVIHLFSCKIVYHA